jgi:hypothetical protein
MRIKQVGNRSDSVAVVVKNAESSSAIAAGTPLVLACNGTDDGLAVVLPATAGNAKTGTFPYGVTQASIAAGMYGEAVIFGIVTNAVLVRGTRAASTDSWTSSGSFASGAVLMIDTVNNAFISTVGSLAATSFAPIAVLAQSQVSFAASASATSDSRTANTVAVKAFIRML